jgi:ABC-2 type transport system permease protein
MKEWLKPYFTTFKLRALLETQYRGAALGGIVTQIAFGLALIFLYDALYHSGGDTSVPFPQIVTYVWLQQAFFRALLGGEASLSEAIMTGGIAYELCRPVDTYFYWYLRNLAQKVVGSAMRAVPMFLFASFLPKPMGISPPQSMGALLLFILSLALGFACISAISNIQNAITMRTLDPRGITNVVQMTFFFLSGNLIPLTLFPQNWQTIVRYQPFAQALDMPIRLYMGSYPPAEIFLSFCVQIFWLFLLITLGRRLWQQNLRRVTIQGG